MQQTREAYMRLALREAAKAAAIDEVPVGAVVIREGKVVARAHNKRETGKNPCAHAELLAIQKAAKKLGGWRLPGCQLYVTLPYVRRGYPQCTAGRGLLWRIRSQGWLFWQPLRFKCASFQPSSPDHRRHFARGMRANFKRMLPAETQKKQRVEKEGILLFLCLFHQQKICRILYQIL